MADTTIDLLKNSSYVGKMDELIAAVKLGGSAGGTNDHTKLSNRDAADQHPIGAITGLEAALTNIPPTDAFIVTLTRNEAGTYSVDKTFAEIQAALQSNRTVYLYVNWASMFLPLVLRTPEEGVIFGYASISSTDVSSIFVVVHNDDRVEVQQKILSKLPNPNALTFTGAVTGSYDGSAAVSVEIPSGGGGTSEREWSMLADVDIAEIGGSTNIELTGLDNLTEFFIKWASPKNESTQDSAYVLYINGTQLGQIVPIVKASVNILYGYSYLRFNGLVWTIQKSAGAVSETNLSFNYQNAACPYNLPLGIGAATNIKLITPLASYQAVSGNIIIYGR